MGLIEKALSLVTGGDSTEDAIDVAPVVRAQLPDPYGTPEKWIARSTAAWDGDFKSYAIEIDTALRYLHGRHLADTKAWLQKCYGESADYMTPAVLDVFRKSILEKARVFGQPGEEFPLVGDDEDTLADQDAAKSRGTDQQVALWQRIRRDGELGRKLKELERHTLAARRMFVRVTHDARRSAIKYTLFPPHRVFPIWLEDDRHLSRALGVLLEIAPSIDERGEKTRRWEFWSHDLNFIINERGETTPGLKLDDESGGYRATSENPFGFIPIVTFAADEQDTAGYYAWPDEQLLTAQRTVNAIASDVIQTHRQQSYGQLYTETIPGESRGEWADDGPKDRKRKDKGVSLRLGPTRVLDVPKGLRLGVLSFGANIPAGVELMHSYLADVMATEGLPPGSVFADSRTVPSGTALLVERQPLTEARNDLVEIMRPATKELLEMTRAVWNTIHADEVLRLVPDWVEGTPTPPVSDEDRRRLDQTEISMGLSSPVSVLMREREMTRAEAAQYVVDRQKEGAGGKDLARVLDEIINPPTIDADGDGDGVEVKDETKDIFAYELEGGIFTINEIRANKGFPPLAEDGDLTVPQWRAKYAQTTALATAATTGGGAEKIVGLAPVEPGATATPAPGQPTGGTLAAQVSAPAPSPLAQSGE